MTNPIIYWQSPDTKNKVIEELKNNKVLITTTDTIPGFLANTTAQGFQALNTIKQDRQHKPYIILISDTSIGDASKLDYFVDPEQLTQQIKNLVKQCWPGPLTVIFEAKKELPAFLKSENNTVAIRCPDYPPLLDILKNFNGLFSTSANISNTPAPTTIKDVNKEVISQVKYFVDDNNNESSQSHRTKPSTIIDVSNMAQSSNTSVGNTHVAQIRVVRQGAYTTQDLEKILGETITIEQK
ncbi:MAG: L-threonylcarbamoyladenylate synthase [Candidatus Babeliales bacterium]|jgi:L-threonylcarbamoyladenylate synthase